MSGPRFHGDHDYQRGSRCRVRPENCASFTVERFSTREFTCVFCGRCLGCTPDIASCTSEKSRGFVMASGPVGAGVAPSVDDAGTEETAPVPTPSHRRVRRAA